MGVHLNPGNSGFSRIRNDLYVDKSGLIALINRTIDTTRSLTCVSRPRRFGKSFAAQMLCAYYDRTCDSSMLFHDLAIAKDTDYIKHLNQYDVIYVDITGVRPFSNNYRSIASYLNQKITEELKDAYPKIKSDLDLPDVLDSVVNLTGNRFIMIIDEWDAPIREVPEIQEEYIIFLRSLFLNSAITAKVFAAVYMTGILPIKKDGSQSAISDFQEFTMLKPGPFAPYVGFTEEEVKHLCEEGNSDFSEMKAWYDGYSQRGVGSIYNPYSVVKALLYRDYDSYWTETSAAGSLMNYISRDVSGLRKTVAELIGGVEVAVDTKGFSNDLISFRGRDDTLTLLIHLGYLAYDEVSKKARIPNEEVRLEFVRTIREDTSPDTMKRVQESDKLIMDTIHMKAEAVAEQIEKVHIEATNPLNANNENSLRAVIQLAYFSYKDHYMKMEELPTGYGYADIVYLPKKSEMVPALVIELKWNQSTDTAIEQIRKKKYPTVLQGYGGDILLVGINYDKEAPAGQRKYTCKIENWRG